MKLVNALKKLISNNNNLDLNNKVEDTIKKSPDNIIRLTYISMKTFESYYNKHLMLGTTCSYTNPYQLPEGMTLEEACKVVSYLAQNVEDKEKTPICNSHNSSRVGELLEQYHFIKLHFPKWGCHHSTKNFNSEDKKINIDHLPSSESATDLYTFIGNFKLFKNSNIKDKYFEWFTEGVTEEEIKEIYGKLNISLDNINDMDNEESTM